MSRMGLQFSENMYGTWAALDAPAVHRRFMFHIDALGDDWKRTMRGGHVDATGYVEAESLAAHAPLRGTMLIEPLTKRFIRYEFDFTADDGSRCRFVGQKNIRFLQALHTMTTLPGVIYGGDGRELARAEVRFDMRELPAFVMSFRPRRVQASTQTA